MIQTIMLFGIGALAGCLLMLVFFPLVHQRAVRITKQHVVDAVPLAINEIQADKDHLRAQFAMSIRRLEISIEEMRSKAGGHKGEIGRQSAEISRLHVELDKKNALIAALRTREAVRKSIVRRIAKILLSMYMRSNRRKRIVANPVQAPSIAPNLGSSSNTSAGPTPETALGPSVGPSLEPPLGPSLGSSLGPTLGSGVGPTLGSSSGRASSRA
jgi:hypothetical protein